MKIIFRATLAATLLSLAACGDSSSNSNESNQQPAGNSTSLSVTPALGKIFNADVSIKSLTGTVLKEGNTGSSGMADLSGLPAGPYLVEIKGNADATYYDEAAGSLIGFPVDQSLRALVPDGAATAGVTLLTETAYRRATHGGDALTAQSINTFNEQVRAALAPGLTSILSVPSDFDSNTTSGSLEDDEAGRYALYLAAYAGLASADATPALTILSQLADDAADGSIDGLAGNTAITSLSYDSAQLATNLSSQLTLFANQYGSNDLQSSQATFDPIATSLAGSTQNTGGALSDGDGITGKLAGVVYTYTDISSPPPIDGVNRLLATAPDNLLNRWTIKVSNEVGSYACGENGADGQPITIQHLAEGVGAVADGGPSGANCSIEVLSTSPVLEGRFNGQFNTPSGLVSVTDGYFRLSPEDSDGTGGQTPGEFGYSMDVDGVPVSSTDILPLESIYDTTVILGGPAQLQLRGIPINQTGTYTCGVDSIALWYLVDGWRSHESNRPGFSGSCTIEITSAGAVYEGTFSGTLFANNGAKIVITNGKFRNDGSHL